MKTIFLLFILLLPVVVYAQDDIYYNQQRSDSFRSVNNRQVTYQVDDLENVDLAARIMHTNFCLQKYRDQRHLGYTFDMFAVSFAVGSVFVENGDTQMVMGIAAGLLSITGYIIKWDAAKWLSRASAEYTRDGLTFKFTF